MRGVPVRAMLVAGALAQAALAQDGGGVGREDVATQIEVLLGVIDRADPGLAGAALGAEFGGPDAAMEAGRGAGDVMDRGMGLGEMVERWARWGGERGVWSAALVGMPGEEGWRAARIGSRRVLALARDAAEMIEAGVDEADAGPGLGRDEESQRRIGAALHEREVVLPLRAARASVALAATTAVGEDRARLARGALDLARGVQGVSAWAEAEIALSSAHALALLGEDAEAERLYAEAGRLAGAAELKGPYGDAALIEATLGAALARAHGEGAMKGLRELSVELARPAQRAVLSADLGLALLAGDAALRMATDAEMAKSGESQREAALATALDRYGQALGVREGGRSRAWVVEAALDHVGARVAERASYAGLPAVAPVALARRLARAPGTRARAIEILEATLERPANQLGALAPAALWELAGAYAQVGSAAALAKATEAYLRFAERYATDERAASAVSLACAAADRSLRLGDGAGGGEVESRVNLALVALRRAHTFAGEVEARDGWRLALMRLLNWRVESGLVSGRESEASAREVSAVAGSVREAGLVVEALLERASAWDAVERWSGEEAGAEKLRAEAATRALAAADDAAAELGTWTGGEDVSKRAGLASVRGRALLTLGRGEEALRTIAPYLEARGSAELAPVALAQVLGVGLEAMLETGSGLEDAWGLAQRLEAARAGAGRGIVERWTRRGWERTLPLTRGFVAGGGFAALVEAKELIAAEIGVRLSEGSVGGAEWEVSSRRLAWFELAAGRGRDAVGLFEGLVRARAGVNEYERGLGEARLMTGDDEGAFAVFREIVARAEDEKGADVWIAWTRMLEILARRNEDWARTAEIRRQIARLRALPSALDQPECLDRLRAVEDGLE